MSRHDAPVRSGRNRRYAWYGAMWVLAPIAFFLLGFFLLGPRLLPRTLSQSPPPPPENPAPDNGSGAGEWLSDTDLPQGAVGPAPRRSVRHEEPDEITPDETQPEVEILPLESGDTEPQDEPRDAGEEDVQSGTVLD